MSQARRRHAPKLEPELLQRSHGSGSLGGAARSSNDGGRVSGGVVFQAATHTPVTIELCDGSQFTFARFADLRTPTDT